MGTTILTDNKKDNHKQASKHAATEWFIFGVVVFMMLLFSYTAVNKLLEYKSFVFQMQLAPVPMMKWLAPILGWLVPLTELVLTLGLYLTRTRVIALVGSLILMIAFEGYIIWMKLTGLDLPCTCGGIISAMGWTTHLIFNATIIVLIAVALTLWKTVVNNKKALYTIH